LAMANPEHLAKLKEGIKAWNQFQVDRAAEFYKTLEVSYRGPSRLRKNSLAHRISPGDLSSPWLL
jgi:hypothetical protein